MTLDRKFLLGCLSALGLSLSSAQTPPPDRLAEIGAANSADNEATPSLVTPQPPKLPNRVLPYGVHDPEAVFQPGKKMETPAELAAALVSARQASVQFLENRAPIPVSTRQIQKIDSFAWRVALSGDWRNFAAVLDGAGQWEQVRIPHYGEPIGNANTFYRTSFSLEAWNGNAAVFLCFKGVDYRAHVFVNGAFAGSHEGFFAPFEFDITRFVRPGQNSLFVQVDNDFPTLGVVNDPKYPDLMGDKLYAATGPGFDDPSAGWHHDPPGMGIVQPVTIEIRPRVHVHDLFVRPLPDGKNAEALIEVFNCDTQLRDLELRFSVYGLNFAQQLITNQIAPKPDPAGGGMNFYRVTFPIAGARRWSLDEPWLYEFQVSLACSNGIVDNARRSFGVRSFLCDESSSPKGRFFLNGQELRLRGANTMGFEQQDVMRGDLAQLRDDLLLAKIAHINFLRITQRPVQEEVYEMADRLGLMIQTDFPLFGHMRPNQFSEAVRQSAEMERLIRSHPSCILITYINERFSDQKSRGKMSRRMRRPELDRLFSAMDQAVLSQNPDRVIKPVDGDYDPPAPGLPDNHCYTLWYFRNGIDFGLLHKGYWQGVKPGWNYGCGEFGAEGLDTEELMRKYCPSNWLPASAAEAKTWTPARIVRAQTAEMCPNFFDRPDSMADWIRTSREHQAWATRLMTEAFRRDNRMVSFAIHLFIDAWPTGWMKAIVDVDRQPKPAFFAYREALTPLMANIRTDRWKFSSGETMKLEFWICNDTPSVPKNPTLAWEMEVDGKIVHARRLSAKVKPIEAVFQGFTAIPVPNVAQRSQGKVRLALFDGNTLVHDTAVDVEFFPKPSPVDMLVEAVGAKGGAATALVKELKLPTGKYPKVYLIDDFAAYRQRQAEINGAVERGACAIFLNLPKGEYALPGSTNAVTVQSANPHFLTRKTGHAMVDGFGEFDFAYWYDQKADMITPLANGKFAGTDWSPILKAQGVNAVAERKLGLGRVILCEAYLAGRVTANPTARDFVTRLLNGK